MPGVSRPILPNTGRDRPSLEGGLPMQPVPGSRLMSGGSEANGIPKLGTEAAPERGTGAEAAPESSTDAGASAPKDVHVSVPGGSGTLCAATYAGSGTLSAATMAQAARGSSTVCAATAAQLDTETSKTEQPGVSRLHHEDQNLPSLKDEIMAFFPEVLSRQGRPTGQNRAKPAQMHKPPRIS